MKKTVKITLLTVTFMIGLIVLGGNITNVISNILFVKSISWPETNVFELLKYGGIFLYLSILLSIVIISLNIRNLFAANKYWHILISNENANVTLADKTTGFNSFMFLPKVLKGTGIIILLMGFFEYLSGVIPSLIIIESQVNPSLGQVQE